MSVMRSGPAVAMLAAMLLAASAGAARAGAPGLPASEIDSLRVEGERFYREAVEADSGDPAAAADLYRKAILRFDRIASRGGIRNGKLYYNIGNAWFRLGDTGRAILNYRRAAFFMPNDVNLRRNLEYARSRVAVQVEPRQREKVFETLFFLHYDLPTRARLSIFLAAFAGAWTLAALRLFLRRSWVRVCLIAAAVVAVAMLVSLSVEAIDRSRRPAGVVTAGPVVVRKGDAETYQPAFTEPLNAGTEYVVVERRPGWLHIELESGARGWMPEGAGEAVFPAD
ncbi:MAG: hypothetical protein JW876_01390 [Candidatus Krumholzibacteriota bacterium]|nr:hypothetical protein [Candidatus Krumholzibacteriota bacterium]